MAFFDQLRRPRVKAGKLTPTGQGLALTEASLRRPEFFVSWWGRCERVAREAARDSV